LSGAAAAIKMQSKKRLPATWLAGDCMSVKPFSGLSQISNYLQKDKTASQIFRHIRKL
jgi:hypothetical protein